MACILVLGTGRSGTSLLMQALKQLGVHIDTETVPANSTNPRGTGEAIAVRDQMLKLYEVFGGFQGFQRFRPAAWHQNAITRQTADWLISYLSEQQNEAGTGDFAIKFPLASLFIPLWVEAAEKAGISLKCVWATRQAPQMINSMLSAYGGKQERHQRVWAQRTYYILRDAPSETPLLHFEDWAYNPERQLSILSELCGATQKSAGDPIRAYAPSLDHSKASLLHDLPHAIQIVDDMIQRPNSTVADIRKSDETEFFYRMSRLADIILYSRSPSEAQAEEENEMRIELLKRLTHDKENRSKFEFDVVTLGERMQELSKENQRLNDLVQAYGIDGSNLDETVNDAMTSPAQKNTDNRKHDVKELIETVNNLKNRVAKLQADQELKTKRCEDLQEKLSQARTDTKKLELREGHALERYAELSKAIDRMEEDVVSRNRYRLNRSETKVAQLEASAEVLRKHLAESQESLRIERRELTGRLEISERALSQMHLEKEMLLNSTSWRVTGPMRTISRIARGRR